MEHLLAKEGVAGSIPVSRLDKKGYPIGYPFLFNHSTHASKSGEMRSIFSVVTCLQVTGLTSSSRARKFDVYAHFYKNSLQNAILHKTTNIENAILVLWRYLVYTKDLAKDIYHEGYLEYDVTDK